MRAPVTPPKLSETVECIKFRELYSSNESYQQYRERNPDLFDIDSLSAYINGGGLDADLQKNDAQAQANVRKNFDKLQMKENDINQIIKCITGDISIIQEQGGKIYTLEQTLSEKTKEANMKEEVAKDAKERAKLLETPYNKTSVWEAWFPLGRPLQKESVPVLLGISIFFLVISLFMFLRLASIELHFTAEGYSLDKLPLIGSFFTPKYQ
jgi:hypothetical protein